MFYISIYPLLLFILAFINENIFDQKIITLNKEFKQIVCYKNTYLGIGIWK